MYSAYKLNEQGDNIQPCYTPSPILNQSVVPCLVLTVASWPASRVLRRQVRCPGTLVPSRIFQLLVIYTVKRLSHSQWSRSRNVFSGIPLLSLWSSKCWQFDLWFLCFSKSSFHFWNFSVHILLKPNLKDFAHNLASMWNKWDVRYFEHSLALPFFGIGMKIDLFQSCAHCWVFQICWYIECRISTALLGFEVTRQEFHHLH